VLFSTMIENFFSDILGTWSK